MTIDRDIIKKAYEKYKEYQVTNNSPILIYEIFERIVGGVWNGNWEYETKVRKDIMIKFIKPLLRQKKLERILND